MIFSKKRISDLLIHSKQMVNIASSDDEIKKAILRYNYNDEVLAEGKEFSVKSEQLAAEYSKAGGEKAEAKALAHKAFREAQALFMEHLKFTRLAFRKEPEKLLKHNVPGCVDRRMTAWLFQTGQYYAAALESEELLQKLTRYAITREKLESGKQAVAEAGEAHERYKKLKGKTQDLKTQRDKAMAEFNDWIVEFTEVCRYSLKESPQLLEKLGIQVLSEGYRRKKKESKNAGQDAKEESRESKKDTGEQDRAGGKESPVDKSPVQAIDY